MVQQIKVLVTQACDLLILVTYVNMEGENGLLHAMECVLQTLEFYTHIQK